MKIYKLLNKNNSKKSTKTKKTVTPKTKKHTKKHSKHTRKNVYIPRRAIKVLECKNIFTDEYLSSQEGNFFTEKDYHKIISEDCDVYAIDENNNKFCLLKLRKNVIPHETCVNAYSSLEKQSQHLNDNRGAAAGRIRKSQLPDVVKQGTITNRDKFRVNYIDKYGIARKGHVSNRVRSNIIGYYDMPDRNLLAKNGDAPKCRQTAFTRDQVEKWENACPIFVAGDKQFKSLMPDRHKIQLKQCRKTPEFQIKNTAFSTITINYNYRSALHKDAGDLEEGFGNLMVLEKNKCVNPNTGKVYRYKGGYLGFPKYGIAVDVRQGDFLAMNVHEWHANCPIVCGCPKGKKCKKGVEHHGRLSLVCYLRKNMIKCAK